MNARLIWIFEKLGWAYQVRWPKLDRLQGKMLEPEKTVMGGTAR
jgi:stearoyl-CoA desaturase (delta-9 desaturase)